MSPLVQLDRSTNYHGKRHEDCGPRRRDNLSLLKCSPALQKQESNILFSVKIDTGLQAIMTMLITKPVITINNNYNRQADANEYEQGA